jgi:hypothetical protein
MLKRGAKAPFFSFQHFENESISTFNLRKTIEMFTWSKLMTHSLRTERNE